MLKKEVKRRISQKENKIFEKVKKVQNIVICEVLVGYCKNIWYKNKKIVEK